ncbi:MAG: DegV family protein [Acidobacteriota bacterium]
MSIRILTDSTSYIPQDLRNELGITVIPLSVQFPDESFKETEVDYDYFYSKIAKEGVIPTSSQPSQAAIYGEFLSAAAKGDETVAIFISSDMSGTYETAVAARRMAIEKYPETKIAILDSRTNCMSLGLPVIEAAKAVKEGRSFDEVIDIANQTIKRVNFYFIPANLEYLKKGGRIGGAAALLGALLKITPILTVTHGKTDVLKRARGTQAAINDMLARLDDDAKEYGLSHLVVHHIQCEQKGLELAGKLKEKYGMDIPVVSIGPVIGLHVGPGAIGFVYCTIKDLR